MMSIKLKVPISTLKHGFQSREGRIEKYKLNVRHSGIYHNKVNNIITFLIMHFIH